MGNVHSNAIATPDDKNYSAITKSCVGECIAHSNFVGNGNVQGMKLTLEPNYTYNGWRVGVEAGVFAFRPAWDVTVYNWVPEKGADSQTINASGERNVRVSPVVGASIGRDGLSLAYTYYFNIGSGAPFHSLWKSAHVVTIRYRF